jgi:large subunit ribosomal protein L35
MTKLKTKSGAKKRFRFTASGKVKFGVANKRHGMSKRTPKMIRTARRTEILCESDRGLVLKYMPYNR